MIWRIFDVIPRLYREHAHQEITDLVPLMNLTFRASSGDKAKPTPSPKLPPPFSPPSLPPLDKGPIKPFPPAPAPAPVSVSVAVAATV